MTAAVKVLIEPLNCAGSLDIGLRQMQGEIGGSRGNTTLRMQRNRRSPTSSTTDFVLGIRRSPKLVIFALDVLKTGILEPSIAYGRLQHLVRTVNLSSIVLTESLPCHFRWIACPSHGKNFEQIREVSYSARLRRSFDVDFHESVLWPHIRWQLRDS